MYFSLDGNYLRPSNNYRPLNFNINAVVLIVIMYNKIDENVKCLPEFVYFYCVLEK